MTEVFKSLRLVVLSLANRAAMGCAYDKWSDEFCRKETREIWNNKGYKGSFLERYKDGITIEEFKTMTDEEFDILGFAKWDEESGLRLIPIWAFNYVKDGETLTCISGQKSIKGTDEIDLDTRGGCIAFGL